MCGDRRCQLSYAIGEVGFLVLGRIVMLRLIRYKLNTPAKRVSLYDSFSQWCEANGEYCAPMRRFSLKMEERGFTKFRKTSGRGFLNVQVKMP